MTHIKHFMLTVLVALVGSATMNAHDFEAQNDDGVTIYYAITSDDDLTCAVSYLGNSYNAYSDEYSGGVVIPANVTYGGKTYSVTSIGKEAFRGCSSLTSVVIPNSVTSIDGRAFYNCISLTSVVIPNSVNYINEEAFYGCTCLPVVDNLRYADSYLVEAVDKSLSSYNIKEGTRFIGSYAFDNCKNLTSIVIPNSVTSIGGNSIDGCTSLTSVEIPNSVTSIEHNAFYNCTKLISVEIPNSVTYLGVSAFEGCKLLTSVEIPNSVTSIGEKAFYGCTNLTSVVIPNSVNYIGYEAFSGCTNLPIIDNIRYADTYLIEVVDKSLLNSNIKIKQGTRIIGGNAFRGCTNLTSVVIPNSVTSIDGGAFYGCTNLTSVVIPNSVTSIDGGAFYDCTNLTSVEIPNSVTYLGVSAFYGCSSLPVVDNLRYADSYLVGAVDKSLSSYNIKEGTRFIGSSAFYKCTNLTSVEIPNSVTSIGREAFYYCDLTSIMIPNSVTSIGYQAFYGCGNLATVYNASKLQLEKGSFDNGYVACYANEIIYLSPEIKVYNGNNEFVKTRFIDEATAAATAVNAVMLIDEQLEDDSELLDMGNVVYRNALGLWVAKKIELTDGEKFYCPVDVNIGILTYKREYNNTNWQPLFVPFAMKYDDWKDVAEVAYINNVHQFDDDKDGVVDRTVLEFITKTGGSIEANKPYVIKPKTTGEVTFTSENVTLKAAPATDGYVDCMSTTTKYTLYGTYQAKTDMYSQGYYAMSGGNFMQAEDASVTLPPFRAYLKIESRTGAGTVQNAPKRVSVMVDGVIDNDATGVSALFENESGMQPIYNLAGQKVGDDYKGVVVKNGKKYIVK